MTSPQSSQRIPHRPPGPRHVVSAEEIRGDPLEFLTSFADRFGPISHHSTEQGDQVYMVSTPDLVREILLAGEERFTKHETADDYMLTPLLGEGLLTSHGEQWRRQREITQPMFQRNRVEQFAPQITDAAVALAGRWSTASKNEPVHADLDLTALALEVVALAILGSDLSGVGQGFGTAVDAVNAAMSHGDPRDTPDDPTVIGHYAAFDRAKRTIDRIVALLIDARKFLGAADSGPSDLLSVLLDARDPATGEPLSAEELRAQVMTMVMAGHETTAKALTWSLYLMTQHSGVAAEVRNEIDTVVGDRPVSLGDLPSLGLCRSVLQESMRLYPPIWVISRRAVHDDQLAGFDVPAGSLVTVSPWVMHRSSDYWPEPDSFDPSRFLSDDGPAPFTYLPFGGGPRVCLGRGFAQLEAQLVFATLCQRLKFDLWPDHVIEPQALVTLRPSNGLLLSVEPRVTP